MKLKYFMRGLGIGIIFGVIVMLAAYGTSDKEKMSDDEIIKRAKNLGMIEATNTDATYGISENDKSQKDVGDKTTEAVKEVTTDSIADVSEKAAATTEITTEAKTETSTEEKNTEAPKETTTEKVENSYTEATITVTSGMGSPEVAALMKEAGIIEDADDFDNYLVNQGISDKIQINTFKFNSNMSYEDIAKELTTPKNE